MKYDPKFCEMVVEHMSKGYTFTSFGAICKAGRPTMHEWVRDRPEFRDAVQRGQAARCKYHETLLLAAQAKKKILVDGREVIPDKISCFFILKTGFYWEFGETQKHQIVGEDGQSSALVINMHESYAPDVEAQCEIRETKEEYDNNVIVDDDSSG